MNENTAARVTPEEFKDARHIAWLVAQKMGIEVEEAFELLKSKPNGLYIDENGVTEVTVIVE